MLMGCIIGVFIKSFLDFEKKVLIDMGLIVFGNENFWFSFFVEVCDLIFFFFFGIDYKFFVYSFYI